MVKLNNRVAIRVHGETWLVPRGFGAEYLRVIRQHNRLLSKRLPGTVIDMIEQVLGLVGYTATRGAIAEWPARKRIEAVVYATTEHLVASDNPGPRHPRPNWMPAPWKGPMGLQGPGPTPLPLWPGRGER